MVVVKTRAQIGALVVAAAVLPQDVVAFAGDHVDTYGLSCILVVEWIRWSVCERTMVSNIVRDRVLYFAAARAKSSNGGTANRLFVA